MIRWLLPLAILLTACTRAPEEAPSVDAVDPQIAAAIAAIKAIDNHAHPVRPTAATEKPDNEYDALPVDSLEAESDYVRGRPGSPELIDAHRALFHGDKIAAAKTYGQEYALKVLDQLNIETMLANRVALGPGLPSPRFLWVPFADALMYPLPTDSLIQNSDQKAFFALEAKLLARYYSESGLAAKPATLDQYLDKVVRATLQRHKQAGAVAEKFEMAYLRSLAIGNPAKAEAEKVYASGAGDYRALQDYIFRFIALECGRLGMAVHFHTGAGGGSYFNVRGSSPMLLEPLLNDPTLRKTNFVMLHGGWPFARGETALLTKPNAYLDFSAQTYMNYPRDVAQNLRAWLEYVPEKVLFATDAYPYAPPAAGWEEVGYVANSSGREALGRALTGMLRDREITRERALELARMVLRDNARRLYALK
ncbi:MAG TPA: amidohydrolase family protein [Bryobacteraceae bacterium]|nr:amidohydrolase family protein [Bryobacteraceae bacterium]